MREFYKGKKVLVTGHTGFKGAWLSLWLSELGAEVHGLSNGVSEPSLYDVLALKSKIVDHVGDINSRDQMEKCIGEIKPDIIFHLAAQPIVKLSYEDPYGTFLTNVMGVGIILDILRSVENDCLAIMITSDKCYLNNGGNSRFKETDPLGGKDPYSASKAAAEILIYSYCQSYFLNDNSKVRLASARSGNVIGGGDWSPNRIIPDIIRSWDEGIAVELRSPQAIRPWQHVLDALNGYLMLAWRLAEDESLNGQSFNFGPSESDEHEVLKLVALMGQIYDPNLEVMYQTIDNPIREPAFLSLDSTKAISLLEWKPHLAFSDAVQYTAGWYKTFRERPSEILTFTLNQIKEFEAS